MFNVLGAFREVYEKIHGNCVDCTYCLANWPIEIKLSLIFQKASKVFGESSSSGEVMTFRIRYLLVPN